MKRKVVPRVGRETIRILLLNHEAQDLGESPAHFR